MKSVEPLISPISEYYQYTPSLTAFHTFFYPICTGHFVYEPGYTQHRNSFDSFLLMYINKGTLSVEMGTDTIEARSGQFVLLDCYHPHGYYTNTGWESIWIHFDGVQAKAYYELITAHHGNVFTINDPTSVLHIMENIYQNFSTGKVIREALISKQLTDILTSLLLATHYEDTKTSDSMADITSSIKELAERALLSPYHFIRIFKKQMGFTPHEYLVNTRINTAKYLLKNTPMSVKDICFCCGFTSESVFCNAFKKNTGMTPAGYRIHTPV